MNRSVLRWMSVSLVCAAQALPVPALLMAEDTSANKVAPAGKFELSDDDPDEGTPGGTVRMPAIGGDDEATPEAPTGREKKAASAAAPTAESIGTTERTPSQPQLTPEMAALRDKVRKALAIYYPRHLNTRDNSPWEMMHGIIAYGTEAKLFRGGPKGEEVNAIAWMSYNGPCRNVDLFYLNNGHLVARKGPGLQGHYGQYLAIIAQSHVKIDYPMFVGGKAFNLQDLIEHEQADCQAGEELTFKLIGLMHYLDSDATWKNRDGQPWSIPRLVKEELAQPIRGAACGGTHRLMGLSYAVNKRMQRGQPVDGEYQRAQAFVNGYHRYTFSLQNPDGSFSTEWFVRKGAQPDVDRRLKTTGHITEWLSFSLSPDDLQSPQMIKAIDYLASLLINGNAKDHTWEIGPLGHSLHALRIYDRRMFAPLEDKPYQVIADYSPNTEVAVAYDPMFDIKPATPDKPGTPTAGKPSNNSGNMQEARGRRPFRGLISPPQPVQK